MNKESRMYMRIRNLCGLLGMILPWLALFSAGIATHPADDWWYSISATYYQSPALVGLPGYWTMIIEILLLSLFGISWLVKGEAFAFLRDTAEEIVEQAAHDAAEQ